MKTPLRGEFKLVPTNLPEPVKKELIQDASPRYVWVALPEPVRQIGHEFPYVVLPLKLTPELVFEQRGQGVLCQTEEEAKESMELLSNLAKESVVLIQTAGFGHVGKAKGRFFITEISVRVREGKDGKKEWLALEREIDKATGEVTVLHRQEAANEMEANRLADQWQQEHEKQKQQFFDSVAKANKPLPPPPRCAALTQSDLKDDLPAAKWTALKRQWPHSIGIFERRKANPTARISDQESQDAYLLDLVEQGHDPKDETIRADLQLCSALAKAAKKFAERGKHKVTDLAVYLIAFNWELGWCYFSDTEIAKKLGELLKVSFTPEQVKKHRYRTLGLVAKHLPGPQPKLP